MSLFKPRWRNPDVDIALQAVDGIDNDKLLLKIVKTSKNEKVRVAALKKISSDYYPFIVDLAIKYSGLFTDISQLAVRRLIELEPLSHLDPFGNRDGLMKDRVLEVVAKKTIDLNVMQIIANQDMYLNA
ncbi:MAG: hypothetical protein KAR20_20995, partial [Candidatus Heimdallarchaeota archaeon]|nr:hypothetical protein [Candidatus Heimdallarchaeota archaeon]